MASHSRPPHYPYSFKALKDVPRRIFHPPPAKVKVGRVRSMSLTPLFQVKLSDVLDGQHLPPLSRKDFEEYLLFAEHSPENLYFVEWLRDYTRVYDAWTRSGKPYSPQLALSWSRAKETFFAEGAHFRLNLTASVLDALIATPDAPQPQLQQTSNSPELSQSSHDGQLRPSYPHPSALASAQNAVEDMLRESLNRFVCGSCGNSGRARGLFGIALGVVVLAAGLAPVLVSVLQGRGGRAVRVAAIPLFWLGAWVIIMSLHGVCILIFLFGDARQLYPYELARPKITSPITKPQVVTISSPEDKVYSASEKTVEPADRSGLYVDLEQGNMGSCSSASTMGKQSRHHSASVASYVAPDANARPESCELTVMTSPRALATSPTSAHNLLRDSGIASPSDHRWSFDFDALPPPSPNAPRAANLQTWDTPEQAQPKNAPQSIPTFGPLTKVLSPIVTRAQWEIVVRSALMAVVVALVLGAVCLAVPVKK